MNRAFIFLIFSMACSAAFASPTQSIQHNLVQRLVLFPLKVEKTYSQQAEGIWWDIRAKLTESKRFLIASKNFMESKGVFQSRSELQPADAILLGRLLEGHALLTVTLQSFALTMRAYDGRTGYLLWSQQLQLHPSIPVSRQLAEASMKLALDFVASIPYQGFVVTDQLAGRPLFKEGNNWTAFVYVGDSHRVAVGDTAHITNLVSKSLEPLFQEGGVLEVIAEGRVKRLEKDRVVIELERVTDPGLVDDKALVRFPAEHQRLQEIYQIAESSGPTLEMDALGQTQRMTDKQKERKPLVTAVSFITNIVIMFLIVL